MFKFIYIIPSCILIYCVVISPGEVPPQLTWPAWCYAKEYNSNYYRWSFSCSDTNSFFKRTCLLKVFWLRYKSFLQKSLYAKGSLAQIQIFPSKELVCWRWMCSPLGNIHAQKHNYITFNHPSYIHTRSVHDLWVYHLFQRLSTTQHSIVHAASKLWNCLPLHIKHFDNFNESKRLVRGCLI